MRYLNKSTATATTTCAHFIAKVAESVLIRRCLKRLEKIRKETKKEPKKWMPKKRPKNSNYYVKQDYLYKY